jgi:hypothetical protein
MNPWPAVGRPGPLGAKGQAQRMVSPSEGNEVRREGRRKSEHLIVPVKQGNLCRKDPGDGKEVPRRGAVDGTQYGGAVPRLTVTVTSTDSTAHVKPRRDEPYALIGHVRICGRGGAQAPPRPGIEKVN